MKKTLLFISAFALTNMCQSYDEFLQSEAGLKQTKENTKMHYSIYFAGELFDQKHITGNAFLAKKIEERSNSIFQCILPQNWEGDVKHSNVSIRNQDIKAVMDADLVLF